MEKNKFDIVYIVSHGFAARMLTQTDLLGRLVDSGFKVALIAPDANDSNLSVYCKEHQVKLYEFNHTVRFWSKEYQESRKYFLEDIKRNPALWEKHIKATKYNTSKFPWSHMRPRLLRMVNKASSKRKGIRSWFKRQEDKFLDSVEADRLIEELSPRLVISTYPVNFSEGAIIKAAKKFGSKTVTHILSWDNISCKGHFPQLTEKYIVWGNVMQSEMFEYYGVEESNINICGVPHFDLHQRTRSNKELQQKTLISLGLDPEKSTIFVGMSSPIFGPYEIEIVEWLSKMVEEDKFSETTQLIVRPHPQNVQGNMADQSWLGRLEKLKSKKVVIDMPNLIGSKMPYSMQMEDMERLSGLLAVSSVCLNSGSTLSIDSLMCGTPVVLTSFDGEHKLEYWRSARRLIDYTHLKKLVSFGGVNISNNYIELEKIINLYLEDDNYNIQNRKTTISEMACSDDGNSTGRVIDAIMEILE